MRPILDGKAGAVPSPENLVVSMDAFALFKTQIYGALLQRIWGTVRAGVMLGCVHVFSDQLGRIVISEHTRGGLVAEKAGAYGVAAKDSLSGGREDETDSFLAIPQSAEKATIIFGSKFCLIGEPANGVRH
jgi:hypothetical protein